MVEQQMHDTGIEFCQQALTLFTEAKRILLTDVETQHRDSPNIVQPDERGFILSGFDLLSNGCRPPQWKLKRDPFLFETSVPGILSEEIYDMDKQSVLLPLSVKVQLWCS